MKDSSEMKQTKFKEKEISKKSKAHHNLLLYKDFLYLLLKNTQ